MSRNTPWRTTRKTYGLHQQTNDWYRIRNQADGPTQLHIYDEIGYFGVSAGDLIRDLADINGPLEVHLNSPGGEVWDGIAIYNALMARKDVTVCIDGLAASIASVIAMAGNPILVARQGQMMVHDGFTMAIGNAQDLRETADQLDRTSNNIASIYADHTGRPTAYWREIMRAETWYDSDEAIDVGLADRKIDSGAGRPVKDKPQDRWDLTVFQGSMRRPQQDPAPYVWDPDGDGDNDLSAATDLDNSHWDFNGKQIRSVPGQPLDSQGNRIDIRNASVDTSPWDASRAWHNGLNSDNPAAYFAGICAGRKEGDKTSQSSYALPYRYEPNSAPNASGVKASLGRLPQTRGLINESEATATLQRLMKQINPDYDPDEGKAENPFGLSTEEMAAFASSLRL